MRLMVGAGGDPMNQVLWDRFYRSLLSALYVGLPFGIVAWLAGVIRDRRRRSRRIRAR